jgi:diguanylate cyclase (GGDEF)-like protein
MDFQTLASTLPLVLGLSGLLTSAVAADNLRHKGVMLVAATTAVAAGCVLQAAGDRLSPAFSKVQVVPAFVILGLIVWSCKPGGLQTSFAAYALVIAAHFAWWKAGAGALAGLIVTTGAYSLLLEQEGSPHWLLQSCLQASALLLVGSVFGTLARRLGVAATRDTLTGLLNRQAWETQAAYVLRRGLNPRADYLVAILDIDGFKQINDTLGHGAGDQVLIAATQDWSSALRKGDLLGRWGGDEFVVLLQAIGANSDGERLVQRLREACPTVSFTVGFAPAIPDQPLALAVANADNDLIQRKSARRGKLVRSAPGVM